MTTPTTNAACDGRGTLHHEPCPWEGLDSWRDPENGRCTFHSEQQDRPTAIVRTTWDTMVAERSFDCRGWVIPFDIAVTGEVLDAGFNGATFSGEAWFRGATFSGDASFTGARFGTTTYFDEATFSGAARFGGATFSGLAEFARATFSGAAWFLGTAFSRGAQFSDTTFSGSHLFQHATFGNTTWFNGATFSGDADFSNTTFSTYAAFRGATFGGDTRFDHATFGGKAFFDQARFSGNAQFAWATFSGDTTWFIQATFSGDADFGGATFSGDAEFSDTTFSGLADFPDATFGRNTRFDQARFSGNAQFARATFSGDADFGGATFGGNAGFDRATFRGGAGFRGDGCFAGKASFALCDIKGARFIACRMTDVILYDAINIAQAAYLNCAWGDTHGAMVVAEERAARTLGRQEVYDAAENVYREVGRSFQAHQQFRQRHTFAGRALEMRRQGFGAKDAGRFGWLAKSVFSLEAQYRIYSNYGESWRRPLLFLALVVLAWPLLFGGLGLTLGAGLEPWPVGLTDTGLYVSLEAYLRQVTYWTRVAALLGDPSGVTMSPPVQAAQILLRILAPFFAFQSGLAIQRHFRE